VINRLSVAAVFLMIAGAPFAAGSVVTFAIVSPSLGISGGDFNTGGSYFGTFSVDLSLQTLSSVDITTTPFGAFTGETYTGGQFGSEGTFTDPTSKIQFDSYRVVLFNQIPNSLVLTLIGLHGTFVGGQISEAEEFQEIGSLVGRLDTSGQALLVDPSLVAPEPVTWSYCLLGVVAIGLARSRKHDAKAISR
jgi:hypothetical protein